VGGGKEIPGGFVVAGCDRPELLEFAEESLDQVALFVMFSIEFVRRQAVGSGRDCGGFASRGQVVRLSRRQQEAQRIAERVDQRMDLAAQTAAAAAKSLLQSRLCMIHKNFSVGSLFLLLIIPARTRITCALAVIDDRALVPRRSASDPLLTIRMSASSPANRSSHEGAAECRQGLR
jgi:hypothetical protein